jgi:hypothetical protein
MRAGERFADQWNFGDMMVAFSAVVAARASRKVVTKRPENRSSHECGPVGAGRWPVACSDGQGRTGVSLQIERPFMEADSLVHRVSAEFNEMPGLRLTLPQATRLLGLEPAECERIIDQLVGNRFLRRTSNGYIMRADQSGQ